MATVAPAKPKTTSSGDAALLNYLGSLFGPIPSDQSVRQDASSFVRAQIDPLIAEITSSNRAAAEGGTRAIRSTTDAYANDLAPVAGKVRADYDQAAGESKQAGDALAGFLTRRAGSAGDEIAGKLAAINAPAEAVAADVGGARGVAEGAAGDMATRGFIGQDNMLGNKAAAAGYAEQLPGFAKLEGLKGIHDLSARSQADLADQIGKINAGVPGLVADTFDKLRGRADDKRQAKASALASFLGGSLDRATQLKIAKIGLAKDTAGNAINWSQVLGFKTDSQGNPVTDAQGNLIPTESTVANATRGATTNAKTHATAVKNRENAKVTAGGAVRTMVSSALAQQYDVTQEPVVLRRNAAGQPIYKKQGGGFTTDKSQAEQHTVKVPLAKPDFNMLVNRAMKLPEVTQLGPRYALKPAQVRQIVIDALAAAGVTAPKPKPAAPGPYRGPH